MTEFIAPRALKSDTLSIEDLLGRVRRGQLRMPGFQRPLVWKTEDVRLLLDSVYNGYPTGMLLFWERPAREEQVRWGNWLQDAPAEERAWWIIDGQHRIASFVLSMSWPAQGIWGVDPRFTWYWDVRERRLVQPDGRAGETPDHWLPLYCVGDMVRLIRWGTQLLKAGGTDEEVEQGRQWARHMADFKLLAYVTEARDEDEVRRIFDRTNTSGRGLSAVDVFHGLYGGEPTDVATQPDVVDRLTSLATLAVGDLQFGAIEQQVLVKALLAIDGQNITNLKASVHALDRDRVADLQRFAVAALRRTIEFLREDCGIPNIGLLPYELAAIVLARFFHFFPDPTPRSRILLRRWLWRAAVSGSHAQGLRTEVRKSVRVVVAGQEDESVQRLLALVPKNGRELPMAPFVVHSVASKLDVLTLASWRPRSLENGQLLSLSELFAEGVKAATATHLVDGAAVGSDANFAANRLLHPPLKGPFVQRLQGLDESVLGSHGLELGEPELLTGPQAAQVLSRRHQRLVRARTTMLDALCEWGRSDRPSIDWLVASARKEAE